MLASIKLALRIKSTAYDAEIADLIDSAKKDLSISGVGLINEADPLIKRAITMYAKANFGIDNTEAERWHKAYESLKTHLSISGDYEAIP